MIAPESILHDCMKQVWQEQRLRYCPDLPDDSEVPSDVQATIYNSQAYRTLKHALMLVTSRDRVLFWFSSLGKLQGQDHGINVDRRKKRNSLITKGHVTSWKTQRTQ